MSADPHEEFIDALAKYWSTLDESTSIGGDSAKWESYAETIRAARRLARPAEDVVIVVKPDGRLVVESGYMETVPGFTRRDRLRFVSRAVDRALESS